MRNIVVYTDSKSSAIADVLSKLQEVNVRLEDGADLKDYEGLNPSLIVVENVKDIKGNIIARWGSTCGKYSIG